MLPTRAKRREFLPLPPTQLKIVTLACIPMLLSCILVSLVQTYLFITSISRDAMSSALAKQVWHTALFVTAIALLVLVPVFICVSIWISYRLVGPMRRLSDEFKKMAAGRLGTGFYFRKGDELGFVAESVAEMQAGLMERLLACRAAEGQLVAAVRRLESRSPADQVAEVSQAAQKLTDALNAFELIESAPK